MRLKYAQDVGIRRMQRVQGSGLSCNLRLKKVISGQSDCHVALHVLEAHYTLVVPLRQRFLGRRLENFVGRVLGRVP